MNKDRRDVWDNNIKPVLNVFACFYVKKHWCKTDVLNVVKQLCKTNVFNAEGRVLQRITFVHSSG